MRLLKLFPIYVLISLTVFSNAQDNSLLTLERIFKDNEFKTESFGSARWVDGDSGYTTLEKSEKFNAKEIIFYDSKTGNRSVVIPSSRLIPAGSTIPLSIDDYQWSSDKKYLLIFTNTQKVWRINTRGDYWVLNLENGNLKKLGGDSKPATLMFAKFSPDNNRVAYVRERNIYVENIESGKITALTNDSSDTIINGTSDWVYEEEFRLRDGFVWSPDGSRIAYWQFDTEGVGIFNMINNTDSVYSKIVPLEYPKVGTTNSACKVGVINSKGGRTTWFKVDGDSRNNYIPKMKWAANSEEVVIQQLNRLQNTCNIILGKASDGSVKIIYVEKDDAWVDMRQDYLQWFQDGKYFTWVSEKDGWKHLYLISRDGAEVIDLNPGEFDVISVEKIDEEGGWVYYIASPDNATQRYLYRVPFNGSGKFEKVTPQGAIGDHSYQISKNAKWAFHTYSYYGTPPVVSQISLPDHKVVRVLVENKKVKEKVDILKKQKTVFFKVKIAEDLELDAWMMKPYNFDASKKYPLFVYVYGEPASQTVRDKWYGSRYLWHLLLTQQGYVVVSIDNRGVDGPRGRDWRKFIYGKIGVIAPVDQANGVREILNQNTFLDPQRVGSWGWSGGGQMTLNAMFKFPEIYKTGIAVSFVSDQKLYDTIYQERYMGLPSENAEGFRDGSPINFVEGLAGNLLIIHGTGDDNVHYQNFELLVNELVAKNKKFSMMSYPNRAHSINEGKGTSLHLYTTMYDYLKENLKSGPILK